MTPERITQLRDHVTRLRLGTKRPTIAMVAELVNDIETLTVEVDQLKSLLGADPDRVAVLTENQYVIDLNRVQPVEWELGPSPMLGQVDIGERWMPVDHAYGHALRIIAATVALHGGAQT